MNRSGNSDGNDRCLIIPLREAAEMLNMCRQALMDIVKRGEMPCVNVGRRVYFRPSDLETFVNERVIRYSPTRFPKVNELH